MLCGRYATNACPCHRAGESRGSSIFRRDSGEDGVYEVQWNADPDGRAGELLDSEITLTRFKENAASAQQKRQAAVAKLRALENGQPMDYFNYFVDSSPKVADVKVGGA